MKRERIMWKEEIDPVLSTTQNMLGNTVSLTCKNLENITTINPEEMFEQYKNIYKDSLDTLSVQGHLDPDFAMKIGEKMEKTFRENTIRLITRLT